MDTTHTAAVAMASSTEMSAALVQAAHNNISDLLLQCPSN